MFTFWTRLSRLHQVSMVLVIASGLALVGSAIWGYPMWPALVVLIASNIVTLGGQASAGRHPQENDPNRR